MSASPRVVVILANRNGFDLVSACVDSLLKTAYPNLLIIIADNGSDEIEVKRLREMAAETREVMLLDLGYNAGFAKANNAGIETALNQDADFLWLLNNDTEVQDDTIDLSLRAFREHNLDLRETLLSSIIVYADSDRIWCNGLRDMKWVNFPRSVDKLKRSGDVAQPGLVLKRAEYSVGCSMFFAREFVERHGMMDERYFFYFDDLDFSLGRNNQFIQQPLVRHKVSASAGFKGTGRYTPFQAHLYAKNGIQYYFCKKRIPWHEKVIYLGFTAWVFVLLYVRDLRALFAYFSGLKEGLAIAWRRK